MTFLVKDKFGDSILDIAKKIGEITIFVKRESIVELCLFLRDNEESKFDLLSDLTGVDRGIEEDPRFEVNYHLTSLPKRMRLRLKVRVSEEDCSVPTVTGVWPTADWHERETFDLVGVRFEGHPNLRKILTPDDLEGHPLRKDFPLRGY
ncbi:MAG: NADH-quinone oxidoreductase subunit C [Acidobacteria bacterium]|nr:NADH-quinone oxidoreductase subunit C [Acidobacteriota bacterium]